MSAYFEWDLKILAASRQGEQACFPASNEQAKVINFWLISLESLLIIVGLIGGSSAYETIRF